MLRKFTTKTVLAIVSLILLLQISTSGFPLLLQNERGKAFESPTEKKVTQVFQKTKDYPFFEDFEGEAFPPEGWTIYSQLDVAQNWTLDYWQNNTPGGTQSAYHNSTSEEPSVDNWLVTPLTSIASDGFHHLSFWSFLSNSWSYKKNSVLVSTGSPDPADGDYVEKWSGISNDGWMWAHYFINLEEYVGQEIYIAFRYEGDTWGHTWYVDDVALVDDSPLINLSTLELSQALGINGIGSKSFMISNQGILDLTYDVEVEYLNADGWLTLDPISWSVSSQWQDTVSISFDAAGLAPGTYQANLNIASNDPVNPMVTLLVTMDVVDVNVYPYVENFESENFPPIGWSNYNADGDENEWALSWFNTTLGGQYSAYHGFGWTPQDGWLVAPQITVPEEGFFYLSFWSMVGDASYYAKNSVLISTGSGNPIDGDFVEVWTVEEVTEAWVQHFINIEAFAGQDIYIAFRYEGEYAHYWVIDDIELGFEVDDSPVFNVSTMAINQTVGFNGSGNKSFKVINDGILDLTFEIETEYLDGDGWLSVDPMSGSIGTLSSMDISLVFNAAGLELGIYEANLQITSNDPDNPNSTINLTLDVREAQQVDLTVIYPQYTYPTGISSNGMYVSGSQFGGMQSYLWTLFGGTTDFLGDAQDVADSGLAVGSYDTEFDFEGMDISTAGFWKKETGQWQFLGMNPEVPEFFGSNYNNAYGVTPDFGTVVGMQWYADWSVRAFKWNEDDGYQMLGPIVEYNTRANGISADGSIIFGWAEPNWTRTPVIWQDDEMIFIDNTQYGEAFGASASGNYVTGALGYGGFLWSPIEGATLFENTLNLGSISPTVVLDDGTVFGYTAEGFPPLPPDRRAFVRHPDGTMETFNTYVESRGWFDAADWIFFSINDVTPDGNKFIGAAELVGGEWISFILDLSPGKPTIEIFPLQLTETLLPGGSSTQSLTIGNAGTGILNYEALVQHTASEPKYRYSPKGERYHAGNLLFGTKGVSVAGNPNKNETNKNLLLHYDGDNFDAIGLVDGGTFYSAVRFPTDMIAPFENYTLESVEAYISDIPTSLKLVVWDAGTTAAPGEVIYEQVIETAGNSWNTIVLDSPVEISGADLWIGFEITHEASTYILGIDGSPTVMDGNWLSADGANWEHLSDYGLVGNWNVRARISFNGMDWLTMDLSNGIIEEGNESEITLSFNAAGLAAGTYTANLRVSSNDADNSLVIIPVTLEIESDTSVDEITSLNVEVFPNPASNQVNIVAPENIIRFSVVNMLGQTEYSQEVNDQTATFNVTGFNDGIYLIQVFTSKGISNLRLQVKN